MSKSKKSKSFRACVVVHTAKEAPPELLQRIAQTHAQKDRERQAREHAHRMKVERQVAYLQQKVEYCENKLLRHDVPFLREERDSAQQRLAKLLSQG